MANRLPLVFDTTESKIKELPTGDNLSMTNSSIVDAINITATGTITANTLNVQNLNAAGGSIAAVALSNSYNDLDNRPTLFSGDYNDLINKPTGISSDWADITNKPVIAVRLSQLINDTNFVTNSSVVISPNQVLGLSAVATSGSFADLTNVPNFVTQDQITGGTLTIDVNNTGDLQGNVIAADSAVLVDHVNKRLVGNVIGNVTGDVTGVLNGRVYTEDGVREVLYTGTSTQDAVFRGNVSGQLFSEDDSTLLVDTNGNHYGTFIGDLKGSVFADDSSIIVDSINNNINTTNVYATTHWGNLSKNGSILSVTANNGIQLLPNGVFNIPNATTIDIDASDTIDITATNDLNISSSSGSVIIDGYISIADLKILVAAAGTYGEFQTAIANL